MKWKKIAETEKYKGWRSLLVKTFELPNGLRADFDVYGNDTFVTVVAFTKNREAILVRQFRPGPEMELVSFPEGSIDKGESAESAAIRELLEETGYRAGQMQFLKSFRNAYTTEKQICILATDCEKVATQQLDNMEFIQVFLLPLKKFRELLTNSQDESFTNAGAGFLALHYLDLL